MCTRPVTLRLNNINGCRSIQVPCGKCFECLKQKQNDWMVRLYEEFMHTNKGVFFTLTYSNDSVPFNFDSETGECWLSVSVEDLQKALKRFRKKCDKPFKYFICSEYGPRTKRPHYHGIVFGLSKLDFSPFLADWQRKYGFVSSSEIKVGLKSYERVSRYVSKYCSKGQFENPLVAEGKVSKCFKLVSNYLGISYVSRMRDFHLGKDSIFFHSRFNNKKGFSDDYLRYVTDNRCVRLGDCPVCYHMPEYYRNKIFRPKSTLSVAIGNFLFKKSCDIRDHRARELQAMYPNWCFDAAYCFTFFEDVEISRLREANARESLGRFYNHSKL